MTILNATDDDLPWDPLWAYVLGEEEGDARRGIFRKQKKTVPEGDGLMSYIKDVLPASESRDDKMPRDRDRVEVVKEPRDAAKTTKSGYAWRRANKSPAGASEADDVWEWQISLGNSYDEVTPATSTCRNVNSSTPRDAPPSKDRRSSLFRRGDTESVPSKDAPKPAKSNDSWDWGLGTGSEHDDYVSSSMLPGKEFSSSSPVKPRRASALGFRKKVDHDSWDWQLNNGKKEKRSFVKRFGSRKEKDDWDFLALTSQEKGPRRVRFNRSSSSKDDAEWIDTKEVVAQLERSQTSLFDFVGINPSFEEEEAVSKSIRRKSDLRDGKAVKRDGTSLSDSGDLFAGLFSWDGSLDEEEDESSFHSSTDESSAGTMGEETGSDDDDDDDDDSKSVPTIISDTSRSLNRDRNENDRSQLIQEDVNEVRLSFQPLSFGETSASQLPIIDEETSSTESQLVPAKESIARVVEPDSIPMPSSGATTNLRDTNVPVPRAIVQDSNEQKERDPIDPSRLGGRAICCSVKGLSSEQLKWSEESGIPFHELSPEEQSKLFPKNRTVPDADQYIPSSVFAERQNSKNITPGSPLSLFEYEYDNGRSMYLSYANFGDALTLFRGLAPDITSFEKNKMLVMVEASTVSVTDSIIRHGLWWGSTKAPLPNTPGVDVVGRIYRVDSETTKMYGWKVGDRIISLVKWGGNSRYLSLDPSHAVAASETIDPAMAVCLAETYLTAFQALHMGQANDLRYTVDSLTGKCILLRGLAVSSMGHAIAQLAKTANALNVFAVAKDKHFKHLSSLGITPLSNDGKDWLKTMVGKVDLIISCGDDDVSIPYKLLKGSGNVISLKNFGSSKSEKSSRLKNGLNLRARLSRIPRNRVSSYDVYEHWEKDLDFCRHDLQYLLQLLEDRKIEPAILDRIPLNKVSDAQDLVQSKRLSGFVVCEPWLVGKSRTVCL